MENPKYFKEACEIIARECVDLLIAKQKDYGPGNINAFGEYGVLVRVNDKVERLKHLLSPSGENAPNNESIDDSWRDLTNYPIIAQMVRRGWWNLPLDKENE